MKKFVSILLAVVLIFSVLTCVGCEADKKEENTITYYHYEPQVSPVSSLIYQYNEKCKNVQNRINIVEFDNIEKMTSQLTTELMAGKGPDIITSGELSLLSLSTEKLIKQGVFANIDDIISNSEDKDKLKLSDYNSNILDAGVYDGKRYFIPVTFEPQILLSSSSKLSKYLDNEQPDLTYGNIKELSGNINKDDNNQALFSGVEDYKNVFLNLIDENVDFYSQKYDFDSDDFRKSVTSLKELYSSNEKNEDNIVPMLSSNGQIELFALYDEIAERAVDVALTSPNDNLSFEFQGGEPLANFSVIKHIVEYTELKKKSKTITYNIVTNLTLITQEIIDFIKKYNVGISTSIDGNELVHNMNRCYRNGKGSYSDVKQSIGQLKLNDIKFGAIQTTTSNSLPFYKEIVDEYISMGLKSIFIRPLTPLGCANKDWNIVGYSAEEFIEFYNKAFDYILQLNMNGTEISEGHATIFLSKILHGYPVNYMELRSPCGAGIGQIAYYYDGNIYTCDEGRMLAEMGDDSFKLGNVYDNTYDELINCNNCKAACISSVLESLPTCHDCVYSPYCGTCPVTNLALNKNIFNREPNSYRCKIYRGILDRIFSALQNEKEKSIIEKW